MNRALLLIVDDEPDIRDEMREYLEKKGYRVEQAADGLAALTLIASEVPDALVTDLRMPRCDGFELIERLRSTGANFPIVAIAGTYSREELDKASKLGAEVVMRKPIALRELAESLHGLLDRAKT